jgi:hypothetical protein
MFFGYLIICLVMAAAAVRRMVLLRGYGIGALGRYSVIAASVVIMAVVGTGVLIDGTLTDIAQFVRFDVTRVAQGMAFLLAILAYFLVRATRGQTRDTLDSTGWNKTFVIVIVGLVAIAAAAYGWDALVPWPQPMAEQILVVACGLILPSFLFLLIAMFSRRWVRLPSILAFVCLITVAAML